MSAYSVGAETSTKDGAGKRQRTSPPTSAAPAAFVKWIPGEAITFYAAILGLGAAQGAVSGDETPEELLQRIDAGSPDWFLLAAGLAAVLVLLGSLTGRPAGGGSNSRSIWSVVVRIVLTLVSFVIWTTALPGAWPYGWHAIRDMGGAYALLLVPVAAIFATVAELATKKFQL
jgi:hypothetical protein